MSQVRVLIADGFAKDGLDIFSKNSSFQIESRKATPADELLKIIADYQCLIVRSASKVTKDVMDKGTNLKLIVRGGAGVDNIDVPYATSKGIAVMNTATANSLAVAEQVFALMFSMLRMIPQGAMSLRDGKWEKSKFTGREATGKTLGLIGLGNIGRIVAEKAVAFGMKVVGFDPMIKLQAQLGGALGASSAFSFAGSVEEVLRAAHIVSLHVPKNKDTLNLINSARIDLMRDGAYVINCSRGGIANEDDVMAALDRGKLGGAAFDVYDPEPPQFPKKLFEQPKCVCVPHLGASSHEAQDRVSTTAADQIIGFFTEGKRLGVINKV